MKTWLSLAILLARLGGIAAEPGEEVVVVYNSRVPESKGVADHYAALRRVPTNQVFGFELSTGEDMSRAEFRGALQEPLAKAIDSRQLWRIASQMIPATSNEAARVEWKPAQSRIRYAVLCYGVPLRISSDPNLKEAGAEKLRPEMRRDVAAVDSELALLPRVEERLPLNGPIRNPVYAATNAALFHPTNGLLMVARLDGPTAAIARGLVDKALEAETNGLWGRAYIDLRNVSDPNYKMGDDWLRNAGEMCRRLGFETVVDEGPATIPPGFPMSHVAFYLGWYAADACGPFAGPQVEFMPGAVAYHIYSFSASTLRSTTRAWVGPLLAKGAAATMGSVDEPYLSGTPEVPLFISRFAVSGFSFGEAAYASSLVLSWQTTVIGDPLYRPFGGDPEKTKDALQRRNSNLVVWYYMRLLNANLAAGRAIADAIATLENFDTTRQSAILSEKLGDLYAAQGKPASAVHQYLQALKLDPSPQQRLRLLLASGDRLAALERDQEAYDVYSRIVAEWPDYPAKIAIYQKLLPLARKLDKQTEAATYEASIAASTPKADSSKPEPR